MNQPAAAPGAPAEAAVETSRLFVALWPDEATRQALHDHQALWLWGRQAVPTRRERLHMTLFFLGDWPLAAKPALLQALAVPFEPFTLTLDDAGVWRRNGIARIGAREAPPELLRLRTHLELALARLGVGGGTGGFEPHITLARKAQQAQPPRLPPSIRWPVRDYVLVESELRPPARYSVVRRYP